MSERYGSCQLCKGRGVLLVEMPVVDNSEWYLKNTSTVPPSKPLAKVYARKECPRCGGEGFSGNADARKTNQESI